MVVEVGRPAEAMSVDFARATGDLAGLSEVTASDVRVFGPGAVELELRPTEWLVLYGLQASLPEGVPSGDEHARVFAVPQVVLRDAGDHIVGGAAGDPIEITDTMPGRTEISVDYEALAFPTVSGATTQVFFTDFSVE